MTKHVFLTEDEIKAARERCDKATPGPLTFEKHESYRHGSWHYAIKTAYNHPDTPWSPRFVAWMCGSLGESVPSRSNPEDYRTDPQIEADAELFVHARTDLPRALADLSELRRIIGELAAAFEPLVWRERPDCTGNPYCILCGTGREHATKFSHLDTCVLYQAQAITKEKANANVE